MKITAKLFIFLMILVVGCSAQQPSTIPPEQPTNAETSPDKTIASDEYAPAKDDKTNEQPSAKPLRKVTHEGDFVVSSETVTIRDQELTLRGNLIVNETGKLVITNSELRFQQEYNQQYRAYIKDNAILEMRNVRLHTDGKWFNFQYNNDARAIIENVHGEDCCLPWHGSSDNVQFDIKGSTVGLTVNNNVKVQAEGSSLFFELVLSNVQGRYELPSGYVNKYDLVVSRERVGTETDKTVPESIGIHVINSTFTDWGATLDKNTDITFVNSKMTLGLNAGSDWSAPERQSPHVIVSGLKTKTYDDFSLAYDTNKLRLINTFVRDWYPQAWDNAVVEISDSDLADIQSNGGQAKVIIRDSTAMLAIARESVQYEFYYSVIKQDAIAHDNARIYLHNTKVGGEIKEIGNGKVITY